MSFAAPALPEPMRARGSTCCAISTPMSPLPRHRFGVDDYSDEDIPSEPDDDIRALHYCIARLRVTDVFDFARSFYSLGAKLEALRGGLLKGVVYQADLHEFLVSPKKRIREVRFERGGFEQWTYDFLGTDASMAGLTIDWASLTAQFPPNATPNQFGTVQAFLLRKPEPQTGRLAAFRRDWFGRIIDRYRNSRTKIVFLRLPRGPIPRPARLAQSSGSVIREFASHPNVLVMDEGVFEPLEHPELFADGMHMNKPGVALFSTCWPAKSAEFRARPGRRCFSTPLASFVFLAVVLALFYALPRRFRKYLLLAASYFFYASWNPKFIALLLTLTAIDFTAGIWLEGRHARAAAMPY